MANIFISCYAGYGTSTYKGLYKELIKQGNNVLFINWWNIVTSYNQSDVFEIRDEYKYLVEKVKNFNPDLVLNYNFTCPVEIIEQIEAPVIIIAVDDLEYFSNLALWKDYAKSRSNCYLAGIMTITKKSFKEALGDGFDDTKYLYLPLATNFKNTHIPPKRNIVMLCGNWYGWGGKLLKHLSEEEYKIIEYLYDKYLENPLFDYNSAIEDYKKNNNLPKNFNINAKSFTFHYAGLERTKYFDMLEGLGFEQFGYSYKPLSGYLGVEIGKMSKGITMYDPLKIEELYNSSKIGFNKSHILAYSGFTFRVMDIMATGACLLMEDKPDWRDLFSQYVSKETLDSVLFKDRFDMREKAKKLLADEDLRQRCVKDLNYAIEMNGRWLERVKRIEKFTRINLSDIKNQNQIDEFIDGMDFEQYIAPKAKVETKKYPKVLASLKIACYALILILAQIPFLFMKRNRQRKLIEKLQKYWKLKYGVKL